MGMLQNWTLLQPQNATILKFLKAWSAEAPTTQQLDKGRAQTIVPFMTLSILFLQAPAIREPSVLAA